MHELFEEQVEKRPDAIALEHGEQSLTYGELNARANRLAHRLRELGVGPDVRVAICLERGIEIMVGLLATLKAGGAYVPLDPTSPPERLTHILEDLAPTVLLTHWRADADLVGNIPGVLTVDLATDSPSWEDQSACNLDRADIGLDARSLAYIFYTSGSTGRPKGVMVEHRSLTCQISYLQAYYNYVASDRLLQFVALTFDASLEEIFGAWFSGACLILRTDEWFTSGQDFWRLCWEYGITIAHIPAAFWQQVGSAPDSSLPAHLRTVITGGDTLQRKALSAWFARRGHLPQLFNGYGPTETTINATIDAPSPNTLDVPSIGRPIANAWIYILDASCRPAPIKVTGELYIGGAGVTRGYLNRPDLTAERFLPDLSSPEPGARLYKTGDLGRWLPDGRIEFLGRNDFQVKIRGFRIELGEIEAKLAGHPWVQEVVVVAREDGEAGKRLVAYYTGEEIGAEALRAHLSSSLPEYMVPAAYVRLESLPLTPNGKLDRRALPVPEGGAYVRRGYEPPVGETETRLAQIWAGLLQIERVARHDNFFELGGHSLMVVQVLSRLRQTLGVELRLTDLFSRPTLADFALVIESAAQAELPPITPVDRNSPLELSFAQQRLWFLAQFEGGSEAYHASDGLRLQGDLDRKALHWALDRIVARHESLRATFSQIDGRPIQIIGSAEYGFRLQEHDLRHAADAEAELRRLALREVAQPFDLERGPLIRGQLVQIADDDHALLLTMHHIISDGWSMGVLIDELSALYKAYCRGEAAPLPDLPIQYADYAAWQRRWLSGDVLRRQSEYWKNALAGAPALLELPTDRARPSQQDYAGDIVEVELEADLTRKLKALSQRHGATLYMTLLTSWGALLARLSGQDEVVIGTPVANRMRAEIEPLIGFFVNTLALRIDLTGSPTVAELLAQVRARALEAQQNQDIPFEQVVEIVQPPRSLAHAPIFQVMLVWQNAPEGKLDLPGLTASPLAAPGVTSQFDLSLELEEKNQQIVGILEYATSLFDRATVRRYLGYWRRLLEGMVANEAQAVDSLPMLGQAERRQVLVEWNTNKADYPAARIRQEKCVHELFEAQVEKSPEAIALVHGEQSLTYHELNVRASQLAHYLRGLGAGPEVIVGICFDRSVELVVGLLGIMKSGGAYLPLDPLHPEERLTAILTDAKPQILLTQQTFLPKFAIGAAQVVCLDLDSVQVAQMSYETPPNLSVSKNLAYVIYTSGSTGKPKGVMVEHRSLANAFFAWNHAYDLDSVKSHLQMANVTFDVFAGDMVRALCSGGKLVLCPRDFLLSPRDLYELMRAEAVDSAEFVPAVLRHLAEYLEETRQRLYFLRLLVCGSEMWTAGEYRRFQNLCSRETRLINSFGITEATIDSAYYEKLDEEIAPSRPVPIGGAFANTHVYIMNKWFQPFPVGVSGEIYIGGAGVARGYLQRAELTAERFVPDPYSVEPGARLYKTGDLGRWLPEGDIEFLGRNDFQVKIRGFRIELGEIEANLASHPGVLEAVALARKDDEGAERLVAYYTGEEIGAEALRAYLTTGLPEYMVPSAYVRLEALPLTPNGKLDRRALPAPEGQDHVTRGYEPPVGETETRLARIWADLLKLERVGRHDNFFELGGHSLLVTMFLVRVKREMSVDLDLTYVFRFPELALLAEHLVNMQLSQFDADELAEIAALLNVA